MKRETAACLFASWRALLLLCASVPACAEDLAQYGDGSVFDEADVDGAVDASMPDGPDASMADASFVDASTSPDGGTQPIPCLAMGAPGTCLPTTSCGAGMMSVAGYCPGAADIQCCVEASATSMCEATDVPQPNAGLTVEPPGVGGCPPGMARVATYCVDRFEASLAEVTERGALVAWSPYFNPGTRVMRALSIAGAVPQGYINRTQSEAACTNAGKRLCTSDEWIRACEGEAPGTLFPYGETRMWDVCNDRRSQHPAVEYFGTTASWIYGEIDHACLNQLPNSLATTGSHPGCESDEGIFDLVGNLHEWTLGTPSAGKGVFRGGFYVDTVINGQGCEYRTVAHAPSHWDYSTGFRCCADAP